MGIEGYPNPDPSSNPSSTFTTLTPTPTLIKVATLLLRFLNALPHPIMTYELYSCLVAAQGHHIRVMIRVRVAVRVRVTIRVRDSAACRIVVIGG